MAAVLRAPGQDSQAGNPTLQGSAHPGMKERPSLSRGVACKPTNTERTCMSGSGCLQPEGALSKVGMKLLVGSLESWVPGSRG